MTAIDALIFAQSARPGRVKTRMCPPLSPEQAAELYASSLAATLELVSACASLTARVVVSPDEDATIVAAMLRPGASIGPGATRSPGRDAVPVDPQGPGDLGARLRRAVAAAAGRGSAGVILLGADSPTLPWPVLDEAASSVRNGGFVIGPTDGGGYYLLGLPLGGVGLTVEGIQAASLPPGVDALFTGIGWSSDRVADQTRERAAAHGIALHELQPWYDLQRPEDLARAMGDLEGASANHRPAAAHLAALLRKLTSHG